MSHGPRPLHIEAIPAFNDNYIWLLYCAHEGPAWVIDPGDAMPVLAMLEQRQLTLEGVLVTHRHPDHDAGIPALRQRYPGLRVLGGQQGESPYLTEYLPCPGKTRLLDHDFTLLPLPGHTLDHIGFYCAEEAALFCGDTLFAGGCGRLFDGSAAQLYESLQRICTLPATTRIYCAHEYTLSNLRFAMAVEPGNPALGQRQRLAQAMRHAGLPTVPSLLSLELATNPFLRCHEPSIMAAVCRQAGQAPGPPEAVFAALREWKNHF